MSVLSHESRIRLFRSRPFRVASEAELLCTSCRRLPPGEPRGKRKSILPSFLPSFLPSIHLSILPSIHPPFHPSTVPSFHPRLQTGTSSPLPSLRVPQNPQQPTERKPTAVHTKRHAVRSMPHVRDHFAAQRSNVGQLQGAVKLMHASAGGALAPTSVQEAKEKKNESRAKTTRPIASADGKRDSLANCSAELPALLEHAALLETAGLPALAQQRAPSAMVAGRARVSSSSKSRIGAFKSTLRCTACAAEPWQNRFSETNYKDKCTSVQWSAKSHGDWIAHRATFAQNIKVKNTSCGRQRARFLAPALRSRHPLKF